MSTALTQSCLNLIQLLFNSTRIKGKNFDLTNLLKDEELAGKIDGGSTAIFRLAPQDYHRVHTQPREQSKASILFQELTTQVIDEYVALEVEIRIDAIMVDSSTPGDDKEKTVFFFYII
ncbi:hypothetical protein EDC94DRAFT_586067 [Helicostylum pulchrum]|nr:hypothetical protein EDC94DRAFT_586067 [Helicostylum pulchrum]